MGERRKYTKTEKLACVANVRALTNTGLNLAVACKQVGLSVSAFYVWGHGDLGVEKLETSTQQSSLEHARESYKNAIGLSARMYWRRKIAHFEALEA